MIGAGSAAGRGHRWLVPAALVILWLVLAGLGGGYSQRLGEVVSNDNAAFLPTNAEATQVAKAESAFVGAEQTPAVVVYQRDAGVTGADRAAVAVDIQFFETVDGTAGQITGPLPSADGQALEVIVPLSDTGDATALPAAVRDIRERAQSHSGLQAHVTGPAGMAGDLGDIFAGADVRLLLIALAVVFVILMLVYRSIILPLVVLAGAELAQTLASVAVYFLARHGVITLNGQSQGALILICIGTATDYALLLAGRYREELRGQESRYDAMRATLRSSVPTILASGLTVIIAMMCLLLSTLSSDRGYGPVFALGIASALIATFTFLPAVLVLLGRAAFWPVRPTFGSRTTLGHGIWGRTARLVSRRPRRVWIGVTAVLLALAAFLPTFRAGSVPISDQFLTRPDSVVGLDVLGRHYPAGSGAPALILGPASARAALTSAVEGVDGVASATPYSTDPPGPDAHPTVVDGQVLLQATLRDPSDSPAAEHTVGRLRTAVHAVDGSARVGGTTAIAMDTADAGWTDLWTVTPLALAVVLLLLVVLLRALAGPLLLIGTVVLSVAATVGISAIVFNHILDFPGADPSLPLFCIVFLIAVGVDYNIFLMARVREESRRGGDTRRGVIRGLTTTGGVITSAGIVLGATFSLFGVLPFLPLVQISVIIVIGVVIDTFLVRALLVPALAYELGRRVWWPSARSRRDAEPPGAPALAPPVSETAS
jgi:RND superfamily putative drug exporter